MVYRWQRMDSHAIVCRIIFHNDNSRLQCYDGNQLLRRCDVNKDQLYTIEHRVNILKAVLSRATFPLTGYRL